MGYKLAVLGTVAVLVQVISGQCIGNAGSGRGFGNGLNGVNLGGLGGPFGLKNAGVGGFGPNRAGFGPAGAPGYAASSGGSFAVTSASPVSPTGVSVLAENLAFEGPLNVGGNLPFLGTVGIEGAMPGAGAGSVSYGCGSGNVGIVESAGITGPYGLAGSPATAPVTGPYSLSGPGSIGPYGLTGSPLGPSAGIAGPFGKVGSPVVSSGSSFGPGLNFKGFNGIAGLNGLRK